MPVDTSVHHLKRRRTKIVATLGPSSCEPGVLRDMVDAGVDVVRLNFSHGSHDDHRETVERLRRVADEAGRMVGVLADLCGPKIRAGRFEGGGIDLVEGERVTVTTRDVQGRPGLIPSQYEALADDVRPGDRVLLDDGTLELHVASVEGTEITCVVMEGGHLSDRKGMNLPGVTVSAASLTDKDRDDARFALELGVDFLALSFVRRPEDVLELRGLVEEVGPPFPPAIIAKIEKPEALREIDGILEVSEGIMVARGDLGVELPPEEVPIAQSRLVDAARRRGRSVIVATQMLESMVHHARPTRAEVSDVTGAVLSGCDAVMLSAETAAGAHPVKAVRMMDRVARQAEGHLWERGAFSSLVLGPAPGVPQLSLEALRLEDAVARATAQLSRDLMVRAIVVFTNTGWSAGMVSSVRPQAPILAVSPRAGTRRRTALLWGVVPMEGAIGDADALHAEARRVARESGIAREGDHILRVWGFHFEPSLNVPTLSVLRV